jgi:conjugative relaxase-like TrwC/TraI family protein
VLNVTKLGVGQERYYLDSVADGIEDYYSGHGEARGEWVGEGCTALDLTGDVDAEHLARVLAGLDPQSGEPLLRRPRTKRVPGFDLTFSAPKSVSVLWGLGNHDTAAKVRAAHDDAVAAALGWLEREACFSRRGHNGTDRVRGEGFVAAAFVHRTSRARDPQLHTHVVVANLTRCTDGGWRTLHAKPLYWQARTAGYLFKAHLRDQLTRTLGVQWTSPVKGAAEIADIPQNLLKTFSTRRREIEDEMAVRNAYSPQAARAAALTTRRAKDYATSPTALRDEWQVRARDAGHDPALLEAGVACGAAPTHIDRALAEHGTELLLGPRGLTERTTAFDRRAVIRAWCEQLPNGAPLAEIERLARHTIRDARVLPLADRDEYTKYSTADLIDLERRLLSNALTTSTQSTGTTSQALTAALDARPTLEGEQARAVTQLCTSARRVDVMVAAAGTGKTFCLDAAADAWTRSGHRVIGAALAATAARQLAAQAGINADTIALRNLQLAEGNLHLDARTVLLIDEAAMAGTRTLAPILDAAHHAHAKVVLIGDPKQLAAIDAGGLLTGLAERIPPITLTENRRQHHEWERDALTALRAGHADDALALYDEHERLIHSPTAIDARDRMAADWYAATLTGHHAIMLAERRNDVADLNRRARTLLHHAGDLGADALHIGDDDYRTGDRIVCLRNNRRLGVQNGTLATITGVDTNARTITISTDDHATGTLPADYLDNGHVAHGYALTIHKSQGLTVDRALILASDTLDANLGYTALSRGRAQNRLYLVEQHEPDPETHAPKRAHKVVAFEDALADALRRTVDDRLATDHGIDLHALRDQIRQLVDERRPLAEIRNRIPADQSALITALTEEHAAVTGRLERTKATRRRRTRLLGGRTADPSRDHALWQLQNAATRVGEALESAQGQQRRRAQLLHDQASDLTRLDRIERNITDRTHRLVAEIAHDPPGYLAALGPPPTGPTERAVWEHTAAKIETYRIENNVNDPRRPLGDPPLRRNDDYDALRRQIDNVRYLLVPPRLPEPRAQEIDHGIEL